MALLALVETVIPLFPRSALSRRHAGANLGLTGIAFALNFLMNGLLVMGALWMSGEGARLVQWLKLSPSGAIIIALIVMDFGTYLAHVLMHRFPLIWGVHLVHHIDPAPDVTTTFRQHSIESLWRMPFWQ